MLRATLVLFFLCLCCFSNSAELEPSEYRTFADKREQQIEARILSISEDHTKVKMERRDRRLYETPVTILSLDDQQFLREWMNPSAPYLRGKLRIFGCFVDGRSINVDAARDHRKFVSIHATKYSWIAVLPSGETVALEERFSGIQDVADFSANTNWVGHTKRDGSVWNAAPAEQFPDEIQNAVQCVSTGSSMAALMKNGTVKVWGQAYGTRELMDSPGELPPIRRLASRQGAIAAVDTEGKVHCWTAGEDSIQSAEVGDGTVDIQGNIFVFLALTRSGEIFEWKSKDPNDAKVPTAAEGEGPFIKIRGNGATLAAQREDGTWLAWGTNGMGIVDQINGLGAVPDIAFFSEPSKEGHGHLVWIDPEP